MTAGGAFITIMVMRKVDDATEKEAGQPWEAHFNGRSLRLF